MNKIPFFNFNDDLPLLQEILVRISAVEQLLIDQSKSASTSNSEKSLPAINWTASKTDLIELIYGLYANKVFNNGKCTIKSITHFFENALDIKLGNTSLRFQEILRRKDSVAFLNQLQESLEAYISRIQDKSES